MSVPECIIITLKFRFRNAAPIYIHIRVLSRTCDTKTGESRSVLLNSQAPISLENGASSLHRVLRTTCRVRNLTLYKFLTKTASSLAIKRREGDHGAKFERYFIYVGTTYITRLRA